MNFRDTQYAVRGLAYIKGLDYFDELMPEERLRSLFRGARSAYGFDYITSGKFIDWILCVVGREHREQNLFGDGEEPNWQTPGLPVCKKDCPYRMKYATLPNQRNALRVEIIAPSDRCGWKLKDGRIGGTPEDYHPCTKLFLR